MPRTRTKKKPVASAQPTEQTNQQNNTQNNFSAEDFKKLSENEHYRYLNNGKKVAHAVIIKNDNGEKIALQYQIPQGEHTPPVRLLEKIEEITRFGMTRYRAESPGHTPMYAKRFLHGKNNEEEFDVAYFSPSEKEGKEPFWGTDKITPLFRNDLSEANKQELNDEIKSLTLKTKGGKTLVVDHASVKVREAITTRKPDQNTVMKGSAKDAYEDFLNEMTEELSPEMKQILKRAVDAPLRNAFYGNYRPEWLHAEGFGLTPMNQDPQREDNLGAAPKWANTEMMVLERIVRWFAINRPESFLSIKPHFEMLLDSELIKHINFEVTIKEKNRFVTFLQNIDPFKKHHIFRKPTDLAQGVAITDNLLKNIPPVSKQTITSESKPLAPAQINLSQSVGLFAKASGPSKQNKNENKNNKQKNSFPTHLVYEKSLVQVLTTFQEPNYDEPWSGTSINRCSGTGFVIAHGNKKYILTNAHCVENSAVVRVRLANNRKKKYEAKRKCVSYQCDLALLEVDHPDFLALAEPIELGEMVRLEDQIQTVGFPMGGEEISISKGIVSRIEVQEYSMSGLDMLQVQIDAAVNHGNSGGPAISNGKVVGVNFQGYGLQGLSYMIPIPIIKHFVKEALSEKTYRGFPILPMESQALENSFLRQYYGMKENQTGVRISKIDYLCDAFKKLKPDDILLEIDGLPVSNEGTVDIPNIGNCISLIHVTQMKFIGDAVALKILRKNTETGVFETYPISVTLDRVPLETEKVPQDEHDKTPTYYIASGVSFTPLSRNYLSGKGAMFEDFFVVEEDCFLPDMPKSHENDQIIIINEILDCDENQGYEGYENSLVRKINGKTIHNIHDVIEAIENNREPMHRIITGKKNVIIAKNMSQKEHQALLNKYNIYQDRSDDLLDSPQYEMIDTISSETLSDSDSFQDKVDNELFKETSRLTPGQERFVATIDALERQYQGTESKNNDSSDLDFQLDLDDDKDSPLSSTDHEKRSKSHFNDKHHQSRHRLFKKRPASEHHDDAMVLEPPKKRRRI